MRGNEFLDKMALIDPAFVEAADAMPKKKKAVRIRRFSVGACLCLAIAGTATAYLQQNAPDAHLPVPNPDGTIVRAEMPEEFPDHQILRPGDEGYIAPAPTPAPFPAPAPEDAPSTNGAIDGFVTSPPESSSGVFLPNNATEIPDIKPHISRYGDSAYSIDYAIGNGCAVRSLSLEAAMEHYGDTANYRVYIELFCDGVQIAANSEAAWAEAKRLGDLGYTPVLETFRKTLSDGSVSETYHFSLNFATRKQIENFPASENLGYMLTLYGEHFGESAQPDAVIFNSADRVFN